MRIYRFLELRIKHLYRCIRGYGWYGNYLTWNRALAKTSGYNSDSIHDVNLEVTKRVLNGEGTYVRDGAIFFDRSYDFHILTYILAKSSPQGSVGLNFIDFGGNYASFYIKNRDFIEKYIQIDYRVIELKELVDRSESIASHFRGLSFHYDLESALNKFNSDNSMLLLSSVLGYIDDYQNLLSSLLKQGFSYVFVDRTLVTSSDGNRICVQKVHPALVKKSSYPCRIFSEKSLIEIFFEYSYAIEFSEVISEVRDYRFGMKYFVFKRIT